MLKLFDTFDSCLWFILLISNIRVQNVLKSKCINFEWKQLCNEWFVIIFFCWIILFLLVINIVQSTTTTHLEELSSQVTFLLSKLGHHEIAGFCNEIHKLVRNMSIKYSNVIPVSQCPEMILNKIEKTFNKTYTGLKRFLPRFQISVSQNPSCKGMESTS